MTNESGAHAAWTRQHRDDSGHGQEGADAARFHQATVTSTQLKTHKLCISGILFRLLIFRPRLAEGNGNLRTRNCREGGLLSCQVYREGSEGRWMDAPQLESPCGSREAAAQPASPLPVPPSPHTHTPGEPRPVLWGQPQGNRHLLGGTGLSLQTKPFVWEVLGDTIHCFFLNWFFP